MSIAGALPYTPPRHALLWLLATLLLATAPHVTHLPLASLGLCLLVGGYWGWWVWGNGVAPRLGTLLKGGVTALGLLSVLLRHQQVTGRDAGVALLVVMMFMKMLEMHERRDPLLVILLSYFLLMTHFLYDQPPWLALYTLAMALFLTALLIAFGSTEIPLSPRATLRLAGQLALQAAPVMAVLFILFPRLASPLFSLPSSGNRETAVTGLTSVMQPNSIRQLITSGAVAFRADFQGQPPPQRQLYWRALVLWTYNGNEWRPGPLPPPGEPVLAPAGRGYRYRLALEPHHEKWLLALDLPIDKPEGERRTGDFTLQARRPVDHLRRYTLTSFPDYVADPEFPAWQRGRSLQLPKGFNPRAVALAQRWRQEGLDAVDLAKRALAMFRQQPFHYTLSPPVYGWHPVDEFLFEQRRGFCEHYAQAFTVLMRAAGVPARIVLGYQGGEWNPFSGQLTVRQADAHAWSEVWLEGEGWVRLDPTAAVAPHRVERGVGAILSEAERNPLFHLTDNPLLQTVRQAWDAFDANWNDWFLGYGPDRQRELLARLGWRDATYQELMIGVLATGMTAMAVWALLLLRRRPPWRHDPVVRQYHRFCQRLARRGLVRAVHEGPLDFAQRVAKARPELATGVWEITGLYVGLRYGAQPPQQGVAGLKQRVTAFRP